MSDITIEEPLKMVPNQIPLKKALLGKSLGKHKIRRTPSSKIDYKNKPDQRSTRSASSNWCHFDKKASLEMVITFRSKGHGTFSFSISFITGRLIV